MWSSKILPANFIKAASRLLQVYSPSDAHNDGRALIYISWALRSVALVVNSPPVASLTILIWPVPIFFKAAVKFIHIRDLLLTVWSILRSLSVNVLIRFLPSKAS